MARRQVFNVGMKVAYTKDVENPIDGESLRKGKVIGLAARIDTAADDYVAVQWLQGGVVVVAKEDLTIISFS